MAERIRIAQEAQGEELWKIVRDSNPEVLMNATMNRHLQEDMAVFIAKKKASPPEALSFLATDMRFKDSYPLKLALCKNPKTPLKITMGLLKFLRIFDLSDLTRNQRVPINIRQKVEYNISQQIPSMPSGVKTALARRANNTIIMMLLEKSDPQVASTCLDSPVLTEGDIYKIINKQTTKSHVIGLIADHRKWSLRYAVRFALVRNFYTPMGHVVRFISQLKTVDLKELHNDPKLPASTRPFIFRELRDRNETTLIGDEPVFSLTEEDDDSLHEVYDGITENGEGTVEGHIDAEDGKNAEDEEI